MSAPKAKRGTAGDCVGIYATIDPKLHEQYVRAVGDRNITKRQFIEAAMRRELADPSVTNRDEGLYDVAS